jgi:hypothetical protein
MEQGEGQFPEGVRRMMKVDTLGGGGVTNRWVAAFLISWRTFSGMLLCSRLSRLHGV